MSDNAAAGLCRMNIRTSARSVDLAVPSDVPIADLLPVVIGYAGDELEESGLEHGGWVLQRLGGAPLDLESTAQSLHLRDGDTLYLRPRVETLPEAHFDDVVDGMAGTLRDRPHQWSPDATRRLLRTLLVCSAAAALVVLALPGPPVAVRAAVAAALGLLLLAGAAAASRAMADNGTATALAVMAGPCLGAAGWLLPLLGAADGSGDAATGSRLLSAAAASATGAGLALILISGPARLFLASAVVAVAAWLAGLLMVAFDLPAPHAAALVAVAAALLGAGVPGVSFWLAGLRMPPLPTNAEELQQGIDPEPGERLVTRTVRAEAWMTALYGAVGAVCAGALTALGREHDTPARVTTAVLALLLALHSRGIGNAFQRVAVLAPGLWGAAVLIVSLAADAGAGKRLLAVVLLSALTAALAVLCWFLPGRRLVPHWGRAAELLHSAAAIALLPLLLWVLGVYGRMRGLLG
ncbi:type VII secretion integral membrane protein EccD [Streptomyces sp. HM190]|uniref:type VII secretion integral membrane protein EccD n=1 Tax=Streptomyces sp. HM190 TaxID=2695266 RepID=UPI001358D0A3|nr:type VII secretion integral membrane protein EccD [Streptomyces sp. HM190]